MRALLPVRANVSPWVAASLLVLIACSSGRGTTEPPKPSTAVACVQVNIDTVRLKIGRTAQLTAHAVDASGTVLTDVPITYGMRNTAVASVSASGTVGAARLGTTSLHVSAGTAETDVPVVVSFDSASYTRRPLSGGPFGVAPGDTLAYASNYGGEVREFDLRTRRVTRTFTAPGVLQEVVVSGDGRELYVGNESGYVEVFDLAGGTTTPVVRLGVGQVFGMALGPDGNTLFVARTLDGAVAAIDRTSRKTLFSHPIGGLPRRVKFAASGTAIVVANEAGWVDVLR